MTGSYTISCPIYGPTVAPAAPTRRAGLDVARTTGENRKHWQEADSYDAVTQLTPPVRKRVRDRSRHEVQNNTYAAGAVRTYVNDTVGRGPRLQLLTDDDRLNAAVEGLWREWAAAADWALTTRVACGVGLVAGECFGSFRDSKRLARMGLPVSLDLRLIEPDQVSHGVDYNWLFNNPRGDDGIVCDADGEVEAYKILRAHPGNGRSFLANWHADTVAAEDVLHWFQPTRPGQLRGVTPLAPALPIFAQLRRFTSATLTAAEVAAMLAGVMTSDLPASMLEAGAVSSEQYFDTVDLVRGTLLTLPAGTTAQQFKPEQPTTNYDMFVRAKLKEIGRSINMPYGKLAGDHSAYNYSSGRLDDAPYWADRDVERDALEAKFFNPFFYRWCDFARFALPALAAYKGQWWQLKHAWQYDPRPTSDPVKDATGDELNLTNGTDTLSDIAAREGTTVDELIAKHKRDIGRWRAAGLPDRPWMVGTPAKPRPGDGVPQNPGDAKAEVTHVAA